MATYSFTLAKCITCNPSSLAIGKAKAKASQLLQLRANKKLVQQQLINGYGNVVLLKDLTNLASSLKRANSSNDLVVVVVHFTM